eukprot:1157919-Pelagomonas_calceolata.AAC.6
MVITIGGVGRPQQTPAWHGMCAKPEPSGPFAPSQISCASLGPSLQGCGRRLIGMAYAQSRVACEGMDGGMLELMMGCGQPAK